MILLINTHSFGFETCTKTMSVVVPIAIPSILSYMAEVPQKHPQFEVNFLSVLYSFSGHSKLQFFSSCKKPLHSVSMSTLHKLSHKLSFTPSMFVVSFSILNQKLGALSVGYFHIESHCVHSSTLRTQTTTSACSYCFFSSNF